MKKIDDAYIAKIQALSDEEVMKIGKIIELLCFVEEDRKSQRKFYIPLSYYPNEISNFELIKILQRLEQDFHVIKFLGLINEGVVTDIYYPEDSLLFDCRDLINKRIKKIKPQISLKNCKVTFNDATATIEADGIKCPFEPQKYEHLFIRAMYEESIGVPISWDILYEKIIGEEPLAEEKNRKMIGDTTSRTNKKIANCFGTDEEFFSRKNNQIIRNF